MKKSKDEDYSGYVNPGHNRPQSIEEVTKLAEKQVEAQDKVEFLTGQLSEAKEELRKIAEEFLPEKMEELGLNTFSTSDGKHRVEIVEKVRGSLPVENRPKGMLWLEANGFSGMIKSKVIVEFPRDQLPEANKLVEELRLQDKTAVVERKIEPQTLDAFIREQLSQGKEIPLNIFGVYRQRIAKVEG